MASSALLALVISIQSVVAQSDTDKPDASLPAGSARLEFENLEGLVLFQARLKGADRDTSGLFALDTGAGYLALDHLVAHRLGLTDDAAPPRGLAVADRALARFDVGSLRIDYVTPLLTIDGEIVRRVCDRPVIGLLGQRMLVGRAVIVDYQAGRMTILPVPQQGRPSSEASRRALAGHLSRRASAIPFELAGDGKILVRGTVSDPDTGHASELLTWIVDTGATRCVLFADAARRSVPRAFAWRAMEGLTAPTLLGDEPGRVACMPRLSVKAESGAVDEPDVEIVIIGGPLERDLAAVVSRPVHGLIGYSFLGRFRIGIDYVNRTLWLDPLPEGWEGRPWRDSQIGLQLERRAGAITVAGVVRGSPADEAGIHVGDRIVTLGGTPSRQLDVPIAIRRLEGRPGTSITLTVQRGEALLTHKLLRRRLL